MSTIKLISFFTALLMATALLLSGCSQDEDMGGDGDLTAATFNAGITATRTADGGNTWTTTDRVGIFMVPVGSNLTTANVLANNVEHTVTNTTTGELSSVGGTIYYPQSGNVDFMAYYPYSTVSANYKYTIFVAGQTSEAAQNALDLLYAKRTNVAKTKTAVGLTFDHVLSKVTFNVTLGDGFTVGTAVTEISLTWMPLTATLSLQDGTIEVGPAGGFAALKAATPTAPAVATFTAIIVPQPQTGSGVFTGRTALFTVGGETYTWNIPNEATFEAGNHYTYPVTVRKTGVTVGTPTINRWSTHDNGSASLEISTVRIPAGTFLMGSSLGSNVGNIDGTGLNTTALEPGRSINETQHKVTLTKDFYMSKYQITNAQYTVFLNAKGVEYQTGISNNSNGGKCTWGDNNDQIMVLTHNWGVTYNNNVWKAQSGYENHPVINVTWYGAYEYATWAGGTLPTEAQWEYACRGGYENRPFGIGSGYELNNTLANFYWLQSWSWDGSSASATFTDTGTYPGSTQAVGSYVANGYGLYDMHGNVWEWCSDWYSNNYGSANASDDVTDPTGSASGDTRVFRGGSWNDYAQFCRSACRSRLFPVDANYTIGVRVVFVP